jgi:arylsulfatase A-like enzyme
VLLLLTDDQNIDTVSAYGRNPNASTPNLDRLAAEGVRFDNAFCQSPQCVTSRRSILTGQYPHHTGVYTFEKSHWETDFFRPGYPHMLRHEKNYTYAVVGKEHSNFVRGWTLKGKEMPSYLAALDIKAPQFFLQDIRYDFYRERTEMENPFYIHETVNGKKTQRNNLDIPPSPEADKKYSLVRSYRRMRKPLQELIYAGHNPRPAGETLDDYINRDFELALNESRQKDNPLYIELDYKWAHSPILPPKEWAERFEAMDFKLPEFTAAEKALMLSTPQLKELYCSGRSVGMTEKEIKQMIADNFALCAYGDSLAGKAVEQFKALCKEQDRPWLILCTADQGAHLGDHGLLDKFSMFDESIHVPFIVVSSDKTKFPAGKVYDGPVELVDIAPTVLEFCGIDTSAERYNYLDGKDLAKLICGQIPERTAALVETGHLYGHRACLRTKEWAFSMRTRPEEFECGKDYDWAENASAEDVEMTLFNLENDPDEIRNLAGNPEYAGLCKQMRTELQNRVLSSDRIEYEWYKEAGGETPKGVSVVNKVRQLYDPSSDN